MSVAVLEAFPGLTVRENAATDWAVHDCGYQPLLTGGRLVKAHDPAWQMYEKKGRDYGCLTERVRMRARLSPNHVRYPGYELGFFHSHRSIRDYPGYPDCHIFGEYGDIFRELKRMGENPKPEQAATLTRMGKGGRDVGVWWPCCWFSGRIDWELATLARRPRIGRHGHMGLPPQVGEPGYSPGTAAAVPAPRRASRPRTAAAAQLAPGKAVQMLVEAPLVTGYVIGGGTVDESTTAAFIAVRTWLREHGVTVTPTPLRLIEDGTDVFVEVAGAGPGQPRRWDLISVPFRPFPSAAARTVAAALGTVVVHSGVESIKALVEWHPGRA